ncbi:MAG TPA: TMEM175 family protein [Acidimicrobiales bacterium]|nr:TMEM175 family protein [Acidimicrobiales bacterium]
MTTTAMGRAQRNLSGITKARLEAFSDGVLAIVITLLAIELRPPEVDQGQALASALWEQWPSYLAYLLAFAQIGVIWLNHHRLFDQVRVVDGKLLLLNLNLLMWITLIPFPTALVAEHLRDGGEATKTAVAVFSGTLFVTAIGFTALYAWITHDDRLVHSLPPRQAVLAARIRFGMGLAAYGLALLVPYAALAIHAVSAGYYAFDQATLEASRGREQ